MMNIITKEEIQQRVLKNGKPLKLDLFEWDENTRTFKSIIQGLVLDFFGIKYCTFITGDNCSFKTTSECIFKTGSNCKFDTWYDCNFNTGNDCTFNTTLNCTFKTGDNCIFDTPSDCKFETGDNCIVFRKDIDEIIHLKPNVETMLCPSKIKGYLEKINDKFTYSEDPNKENEYIIVDRVLSKVISRKENQDLKV